MATINKIDTTFSGKDISSAASVYEYTATGTYRVRFQVQFTSLAGGGDYTVYLTLNDGDAVADNPIFPKTTVTLEAGAQSIWFASGDVDVMNGDVINVFALGQAGDTSVAGIVRVFSDDLTMCELKDDAITSAKYDESTAFPLKADDSGETYLARTGADGDTLESLSDEIAIVDGTVDAIYADMADAQEIRDAVGLANANLDSQLAAIQADLDNPDQYQADVSGLALEATLTAIKGTGWTDETLKALKDAMDAISVTGASAQEVWEYTTRTLTQSASEIIALVTGSSITQIRGNSWVIEIMDLTLDPHKQQFAFKRSMRDEDDEAYLLIDSDTGLLIVNGAAAANPAKASLAYIGTTLTVTVDEDITALMPTREGVYGIQSVTAGGVVMETYSGRFTVIGDVVRAVE